MTEPQKSGPHIRFASIAVLAMLSIAAAGALALYVMDMRSGNAKADEIVLDSPDCKDALGRAKAITGHMKGDVAAMRAADRAMSLSGLRFDGPDGKPMSIGDFKSKTLLVNLWATWCVPCREEIPVLDRLQAMKGGDDFQVVAINIDTGGNEKPAEFLKSAKADNLQHFRDSSLGAFSKLKEQGLAFGLPVTLLIDSRNCLLAAMNGPANWAGEDAVQLINAAVAGEKS